MIINKLPQLMETKGLTISELSRQAQTTIRTIVKLYYADFTSIHINVLDKLCTVLEAQPNDLFVHVPGNHSTKPYLETIPSNIHPNNIRAEQANYCNNKEGVC
jgi:DNA-binding Xre family transcriptional regulator